LNLFETILLDYCLLNKVLVLFLCWVRVFENATLVYKYNGRELLVRI